MEFSSASTGHDPDWARKIRSRRATAGGEEISWSDGRNVLYAKDDLPQPMGADERRPQLFESIEDGLPATLDYIPVSQGLRFPIHPDHKFDVFRRLKEKIGDEYVAPRRDHHSVRLLPRSVRTSGRATGTSERAPECKKGFGALLRVD